jgi:hypothetical protein
MSLKCHERKWMGAAQPLATLKVIDPRFNHPDV